MHKNGKTYRNIAYKIYHKIPEIAKNGTENKTINNKNHNTNTTTKYNEK